MTLRKKHLHYIQISDAIEEPELKNVEAESKLKKVDFNIKLVVKCSSCIILVDSKLLQLNICSQVDQKERASVKRFPVINESNEGFV